MTERSIDGGAEKVLGSWRPRAVSGWALDAAGERIYSIQGGRLLEQRLAALDAPARFLGRQEGEASVRARWPGRVVTADAAGEVRLWTPPRPGSNGSCAAPRARGR